MPITLNCPCGKMLRVPDDSAGKRAKCPACSAVVAIPLPPPPPAPAPEPEPVFEVEEPPAPGLPHTHKPVLDDDDDATPYGLAAPEKPDPVTGREARPKKRLPNFRRGGENYS